MDGHACRAGRIERQSHVDALADTGSGPTTATYSPTGNRARRRTTAAPTPRWLPRGSPAGSSDRGLSCGTPDLGRPRTCSDASLEGTRTVSRPSSPKMPPSRMSPRVKRRDPRGHVQNTRIVKPHEAPFQPRKCRPADTGAVSWPSVASSRPARVDGQLHRLHRLAPGPPQVPSCQCRPGEQVATSPVRAPDRSATGHRATKGPVTPRSARRLGTLGVRSAEE